ncbi:single-stranded DNA-binding protein [Neisseriaceae bacterium TC5R-5]|nr:single-stranded DNA-binding protein [Neisseriaceae bacterium TC5R-5]
MNSISFDGHLAADAELRYTPAGEPILNFRVASNIGFGERQTTNWFNCQLWGKRAERLREYLGKGQEVTIYGQLTLREWRDKSHVKHLSPDIWVGQITLRGNKHDEGFEEEPGRHRQAQATTPPAQTLDEDDIPF